MSRASEDGMPRRDSLFLCLRYVQVDFIDFQRRHDFFRSFAPSLTGHM
jgi:hypothetical protein